MSPPPASEFEIKFNREAAYTITYDDAQGRLLFVFETSGKKTIFLHRTPLVNNKRLVAQDESTRSRAHLAFERTTDFLINRGYEVMPFDD